MKLAWFTPFGRRSAVAEFSRHVTEALVDLAPHVELEIWATEGPGDQLETRLPVRWFNGIKPPVGDLEGCDHVIYNFGDYLPYHRDIYQVSIARPGIALLHDRVLHHFFAGLWLMCDPPDHVRYVEAMRIAYGERGGDVASSALRGERPPPWELDEEVMMYPLWEPAVANARGVITHSEEQRASVRDRWFGPTVSLELPCYQEHLVEADAVVRTPARDGRLRALTMGNLNPNKQVDQVLELLAADSALASRIEYTVVGADDGFGAYTSRLRARAEALRECVDVRILGYQPEQELRSLLADTDVFINLRDPVMEGGSASLMRQLAYGRPVLCFSAGGFGELPADSCLAAPPGDYNRVHAQLRRLVDEVDLGLKVGGRARQVAEARSAAHYAAGLLEFLDEVRSWAPVTRLLTTVGEELGGLGIHSSLTIFDRIAEDFGRILQAPRAGAAFREVRPGDRDRLSLLFARNRNGAVGTRFDPFPLSPAEADRIVEHCGTDAYFVCVEGESVVALSMLRGFDEGFAIPSFGIFVDDEAQGRGIGRRLTEWTVTEARRRGAPSVRLSVYATNERALALYATLGFVETSREDLLRAGRADERIVMSMELGP